MKNVIKEIFIMLLLCVAIALALAVVFYEYNPINKEVPTVTPYQMPEKLSEVQDELNTDLKSNDEQIIRTYEITEDDLNKSKKTNVYNAGKVNPFEAYSENTNSNTTGNSSNNTTNTVNTINSNTNTNANNNSYTPGVNK